MPSEEVPAFGDEYLERTLKTINQNKTHNHVFFTNGRFDGAHAGHLKLFETIQEQCEDEILLIVGVDTDQRYKDVCNTGPRYRFQDRVEVVNAMAYSATRSDTVVYVLPMTGPPFAMLRLLHKSVEKAITYVKGADVLDNPTTSFLEDMRVAGELGIPVLLPPVYQDHKGKLSSSRKPAVRGA